MINNIEAFVTRLALHHVGNPTQDEELRLSSQLVEVEDEEFNSNLVTYFTSSFRDPDYYQFTFVDDEVELNPIYNYAANIFDNPKLLQEESVKIAKHLYNKSQHHNIKSGDLMIAHIDQVLIEDELVEAVAIFKCEQLNPFFTINHGHHNIDLESKEGVDINKPDKGCLIINTERDQGYKVCLIDQSNSKIEAKYWREDFLYVREKNDTYHATTQYISATKSFIKERLPHIDEFNKVDEIDILNKSKRYFEQEETFDKEQYSKHLFDDKNVQEQFDEFSEGLLAYRGLNTGETFEINDHAVKKKSRVFKSVLKLDKNFHIYIHGDKSKISKGEDSQGKFYKIYYNDET